MKDKVLYTDQTKDLLCYINTYRDSIYFTLFDDDDKEYMLLLPLQPVYNYIHVATTVLTGRKSPNLLL